MDVANSYNACMSTRTADYWDAVEHLPDGATLVIHDFSWDDYEFADGAYREVSESRSLPGLDPGTMAAALEQRKVEGQTASLRAFRRRCSQQL